MYPDPDMLITYDNLQQLFASLFWSSIVN